MTRNSPRWKRGFQTKGLRLPLRRALITAKDSPPHPRKFVYRRYLAPSRHLLRLLPLIFHLLLSGIDNSSTLPPYFPGPISALSRLVPSCLSLHVCLNSSRESSACTPPPASRALCPLSRPLLEFAPENQPPPLPTGESLPQDRAIKCTLRLSTEPRHRLSYLDRRQLPV